MLKPLMMALGLAITLAGCGAQAPAPTLASARMAALARAHIVERQVDDAYMEVDVEEARALVRGAKFARNANPSKEERHLADMAGDKIKLRGTLDVRQDESILATTVEAILVPAQGQTIPVMVKAYKTRRYAQALAKKLPDQQTVTVYLTVQYRPDQFDFHPFRLDAIRAEDGTVIKF